MAAVVPDGVVCFFVSYSYMDAIINTWNETGILKVQMMYEQQILLVFCMTRLLPQSTYSACLLGEY